MSEPLEMQKIVMKPVTKERLAIVEGDLIDDQCTNIEHKLEDDGTFTVTALCPKRAPE